MPSPERLRNQSNILKVHASLAPRAWYLEASNLPQPSSSLPVKTRGYHTPTRASRCVCRVKIAVKMADQPAPPKKDIAVDLECDDEFEEFGNEGARGSSARPESPHPKSFPLKALSWRVLSPLPPTPVEVPDPHPPFFPLNVGADWGPEEEDTEDVNQWEEDWDDSDQNDDFTRQLRAQLERHA